MSLPVLLNYQTLTCEQLKEITEKHIQDLKTRSDYVSSLPLNELTWQTVIQPDIDIDNSFIENAFYDMKGLHPNEEIRLQATQSSTELQQFSAENSMRKDVYEKVYSYYHGKYKEEKEFLNEEQQKFMEEIMLSYKKMGIHLEDSLTNRIKEIKKEIIDLTNQYESNLDNYCYSLYFTLEESKGLNESYIKEHWIPPENENEVGKIRVQMNYPDYIGFMEYCEISESRKKVYIAYKSRAKDMNIPLGERILTLRHEYCQLLGYSQYSELALQDRMASNTEMVLSFLDKVETKLKPLFERDMALLEQLHPTFLEMWDMLYVMRVYKEQKMNINKEDIKEYFPLMETIPKVFAVFQKMLGYTFQPTKEYNHTLWHEDVTLYEVWDIETNSIKGYFYLDLFPRDGKYGHCAVFPLISASSETLPVAALVCNFEREYFQFDDLETFFHEFGHVMHHISSTSTNCSMSSFSCEMDFVETPSQMFEEWCFVPYVLNQLSPTLPKTMIQTIIDVRELLQGYHYTRQLYFAKFDMYIHDPNQEGSTFEIGKQLLNELFPTFQVPDEVNEIATFGHVFGGYECGYYSYMWSQAFAIDVFSQFFQDETDMDNCKQGKRFREEILCQGSKRSSMISMQRFLGRDPDENAFIQSLI